MRNKYSKSVEYNVKLHHTKIRLFSISNTLLIVLKIANLSFNINNKLVFFSYEDGI